MQSAPPGFLRLAGHPVRWRLLTELSRTDRQVRELTGLLGQPQSLVSYHLGQRFGYVITLCDRVREVCPEFPGQPQLIHWSIADPAGEADPRAAFRRVAAELRTRIGFLLARLGE